MRLWIVFSKMTPIPRVAVESAVSLSVVFVAARFASKAKVDFPNVARKVIRRIGYVDNEFNYKTCSILTSLKEMEMTEDYLFDEDTLTDEEIERIPAVDQVTLFGFACKQSPTLMPLPIWLAHKLAWRLSHVRQQNILDYLAPDGITQVGVEFRNMRPYRIHSITVNTSQKDRNYPKPLVLQEDIRQTVIQTVFEDEDVVPDDRTRVFINFGGPLKLGGPSVHSGLTGRKNAIDTYGGYSRNGGSALSGKDPFQNRQGWSVRGPLCRKECRCCRFSRAMRSAAQLCHRAVSAGEHSDRDRRDGNHPGQGNHRACEAQF